MTAGLQIIVQIGVNLVGVDEAEPLIPGGAGGADQILRIAGVIPDVTAADEAERGIEARADLGGLQFDLNPVARP